MLFEVVEVEFEVGSTMTTNEKGLWSGGGFETRPPERPPI